MVSGSRFPSRNGFARSSGRPALFVVDQWYGFQCFPARTTKGQGKHHNLEQDDMRIEAIKPGNNPPEDINVIVEVPLGGEPIKYEMDKDAGTLFVDRFLYTPMRYPGNYGFVPHTLSADGDPIDVLVCNTRAIAPGAVMNCRPIGVLVMEDDGGGDEKIVAVPSSKLTQRYDHIKNATDLPDISTAQIEHFFNHYKDLEPGKWVKIDHWGDAAEARKLIQDALDRAK